MLKFLSGCLILLVLLSQPLSISATDYTITNSLISGTATSFDTTNPYSCTCDLNEYSCDDLCCCDTDCASSLRTSWKSEGICQTNTGSHHFCSLEGNAFQLVKVADRATIEATKFNNATGKGICVDVSTDTSEFEYDTLITRSQLSLTKALSLIENDRDQYTVTDPQSSARSYTFGYNILLGDDSYLTLPVPDPFGNCDLTYKARYGVNEEERSCNMALTQTNCPTNTRFSAASISAQTVVGDRSDKSTKLTTYLYQLYQYDSTTKALKPNPTTPQTTYTTNAVDPTTIIPAMNPLTCTCSNVVTGIEYIMNLGSGVIDNVHTVITLSDITFDCSVGTTVTQTTSLRNVGLDSQIPEAGRIMGKPGYLVGNPLRIGTRTNNAVPIANVLYRVTGIDVNGACLYKTSTSSTNQDPITFGQSTSFSCSLTVAAADMVNFCTKTATSSWPNLELWNNFVSGDTYFGKFANANVNYLSDFVGASGTTPSGATLTSDTTADTCKLFTESTVSIYWSSVGYYEGYQNYISNVRVSFDEQQTVSTLAANSLDFVLKVNFINIDEVVSDFTAGARPTIIPQLPRDILYPIFYPTEESASIVHINFALLSFIFILFAILF